MNLQRQVGKGEELEETTERTGVRRRFEVGQSLNLHSHKRLYLRTTLVLMLLATNWKLGLRITGSDERF